MVHFTQRAQNLKNHTELQTTYNYFTYPAIHMNNGIAVSPAEKAYAFAENLHTHTTTNLNPNTDPTPQIK